MTSISILKQIKAILSASSELTGKIGNNMFPLIAKEDVTFPFVIYTKGNIQPIYSKQFLCGENVTVNIAVADKTYSSTVDICEIIRGLLEHRRDGYFNDIILQNVYEEFNQDTYIQTLEFKCTILK